MKSREKRAIRRKKVWVLHVLAGYTIHEVADQLGVSPRTVMYDLAYLRKHPEEIPSTNEEGFAAWVQNQIVRILSESKELTDWQKIKILRDLARSQVTKRVRKEERINIAWGQEQDSSDKE